MGRFFNAGLVAVVLIAALATPAGAQNAPTSLKVAVPPLFLASEGTLATVGEGTVSCPPTLAGPTPSATTNFLGPTPANGSYHLAETPPLLLVAFTGNAAGGPLPANPTATNGMRVDAALKFGAVVVAMGTGTVTPGPNPPLISIQLALVAGLNASAGAVSLDVTFVATGAAPANNIALACGANSKFEGPIPIVLGAPGDGDFDADGIPDLEDADIDNDGAANAAERGIPCTFNGNPVVFERNTAEAPGDHDGDGVSDAVECQKGSNPLNDISVPAPPPPFPWGLLITGIILLLLIAALVFFFTVYGKAAVVKVVSAPELIVPAGGMGKFQLTVQNLQKKGAPITYQLSATGMPEGWDARVQPGSVVLDPVGGAKNLESVWLTVEAPTHTDPESAVVVVKAIALNSQGRKDTLKLPASAKTITSINVPSNAKVPVHRGQAVKLRKDGGGPGQAPTMPDGIASTTPLPAAATIWLEKDRPVIDIEGIGETYTPKLEAMGVSTVQQLHGANAAKVAKKLDTNETTVRQWQEMAELIDVDGVGPQIAELLVRSGVHSIAQLAKADPKELAATVERTNADRKVKIQGGPAGAKSVKNWIKAAAKHPFADRAVPEAPAAPAAPSESPADEAPAAATPAAAAKPNLQVGGLVHAPATFSSGQEVKSTVTVTNAGAAPQSLKLSLFVNDTLADAQSVTVKPGKSKEVKFKWTAQEKNKLNIRGELVAG